MFSKTYKNYSTEEIVELIKIAFDRYSSVSLTEEQEDIVLEAENEFKNKEYLTNDKTKTIEVSFEFREFVFEFKNVNLDFFDKIIDKYLLQKKKK